jgi:hypothetical protein
LFNYFLKFSLNKSRFQVGDNDALKKTNNFITATTNCADPHVVLGNEMRYSSVDAAIAENLVSKGHHFSPCLNRSMRIKFIAV